MVESPTYYRAYQPILKTLQNFDIDKMPFQEELVYLKKAPLPQFLNPQVKFDPSTVYKRLPESLKQKNEQERNGGIAKSLCYFKPMITLEDFFQTAHNEHSVFDSYQEDAVKECLKNRIGIIQGPPGCGKTFIGIHMLKLLLSLDSLENPKVLLLTYKNHALDEFLKGIIRC